MGVSKKLGTYMKNKGYNLSEVAKRTNLDYQKLYTSLYSERDRELRAEELIKLCIFLEVDPRQFAS